MSPDRAGASAARPARASAILGALLVAACFAARSVEAPTFLRQPAGLREGEGAVVGTILLSVPTGVADATDREIVDALNAKRYEAIIAAQPSGERYRVRFFAGVEKSFALRGAPGRYSVESITSIIAPDFGAERTGICRIGRVADLSVRAGQITYLGRLWLIAEYKPDRGFPLAQSLRARGVRETELAETALDMRVSAFDVEKARERLRLAEGGEGNRVVSELMNVQPGVEWDCSDPASSS